MHLWWLATMFHPIICTIIFLFKDSTAWFTRQPPLDPRAITILQPWLCSVRALDRCKAFQKTPHSPSPGDNMLTLLMMCEQDSTDSGLSPDSDKYDLDRPRPLHFSGPWFWHWGCTLYRRELERDCPSSFPGFTLDNISSKLWCCFFNF